MDIFLFVLASEDVNKNRRPKSIHQCCSPTNTFNALWCICECTTPSHSQSLALRVDLPVQLGLRKKFKSCPKNAQNLCRHILGSIPPKLCENCAAQILHNLCTFFDAPAHVLHKFSGTSRDYPAYKFCTIFSDTWHVLKICLCTGKSCLNASEFRRKHPFARNFLSENEHFTISFAKPFAFASELLRKAKFATFSLRFGA